MPHVLIPDFMYKVRHCVNSRTGTRQNLQKYTFSSMFCVVKAQQEIGTSRLPEQKR